MSETLENWRRQLTEVLREAEEREFALAATQCRRPIALEGGDMGCMYLDRAEKAEAELSRLRASEQRLRKALEQARMDLCDLADGDCDLAPACDRIDAALQQEE